MFSRSGTTTVLLCVALSLTALPLVDAQTPVSLDPGRTPIDVAFAMSSEAPTVTETSEFPPDATFYRLAGSPGSAGTGTATVAPVCQAPSAPATARAVWLSDRFFQLPATPVADANITVAIGPGTAPGGPRSPGEVTISALVQPLEPQGLHAHGDWSGSFTYTPNPSNQFAMPTQANIPILFSASSYTFPANTSLAVVVTVNVACHPLDSFTLTFQGLSGFAFVFGDPADMDTDGDGEPNAIDTDDDEDGFADALEQSAGSDPQDGAITPDSDSVTCPGHTYQEVVDDTGDPTKCPSEEGLPWVLILLVLVALLVLGAGGYAGMMLVNRGIKMTVSHDGFQSIEKGEAARFELTVQSAAKKDVEVPVVMELKGVPEDWTASLAPDRVRLRGGEAAEPVVVLLTVTPPPGTEHEDEAQITVTATPTDEEGKTSALKPGASVKTKTIVNIGVTPPEGEGKKKKAKKPKAATEEGAAEDAEPKKKRFGRKEKVEESGPAPEEEGGGKGNLGGLLKRKKSSTAEPESAAGVPEAAAAAGATGQAAAGPAKPQLAMGKMVHDPEGFAAGQEVKTTVPVSNKGDAPVENLRLSLFVNDERVAHENLDLSPGEKREVVFNWTARPDENRVRVKGDIIKK